MYSEVLNPETQGMTLNGLGGDLGVLGFVSLLMVILALLFLVGDYLHLRLPRLGYSKEQILFFLMGQNAFLILLCIAVYTKRSLDYTDAGLRFGIYVALIGGILGTFSIFSQMQKMKKKEVSEFFEHEEDTSIKAGRKHDEAVIEGGLDEEIVEEKPSKRAKHVKVEEVVEEEQDLFEEQVVEEPPEEEIVEELEEEMEIKEEPEPQPMSEEELKDEIDEIAEVEEKIFEPELEPETEVEKAEDEELKEELEEVIEEEEEEERKKGGKGKPSSSSMNFYED
jgi:hypothetical protein